MRGIFFYPQRNIYCRVLSTLIVCVLSVSLVLTPSASYAQSINLLNLPLPGTMVALSPVFAPVLLKGLTIHPDDPLQLDFIIDRGDTDLDEAAFRQESTKLIKYFLAALTVPEEKIWVNLSPYEKDRIIPEALGQTEMGRDLLAQDYLLKQLSSSLMHPEEALGRAFWDRVYKKAREEFGTTEIPMNTFNKIWIVPEEAFVYEHSRGAFIVESRLKVMLEEDYLALDANKGRTDHGLGDVAQEDLEVISGVSSQVVREVLIPEIEKEVNHGKTFADLRQIYNAVILAAWYKQVLHDTLLGQKVVNKNVTNGIDVEDKQINKKIYDRYVEAFEKGVFDFIREDYDPSAGQVIPRKYFSGGATVEGTTDLVSSRVGKGNLGASASENRKTLARLPGRVRLAVLKAARSVKSATMITVTIGLLGLAGTASAGDMTDLTNPLNPLSPLSPISPISIWDNDSEQSHNPMAEKLREYIERSNVSHVEAGWIFQEMGGADSQDLKETKDALLGLIGSESAELTARVVAAAVFKEYTSQATRTELEAVKDVLYKIITDEDVEQVDTRIVAAGVFHEYSGYSSSHEDGSVKDVLYALTRNKGMSAENKVDAAGMLAAGYRNQTTSREDKAIKDLLYGIVTDKDQATETRINAASVMAAGFVRQSSRGERETAKDFLVGIVKDEGQAAEMRINAASVLMAGYVNQTSRDERFDAKDFLYGVVEGEGQSQETRINAAGVLAAEYGSQTFKKEKRVIKKVLYDMATETTRENAESQLNATGLALSSYSGFLFRDEKEAIRDRVNAIMKDSGYGIPTRILAARRFSTYSQSVSREDVQWVRQFLFEYVTLPVLDADGKIVRNDTNEQLLRSARGDLVDARQRDAVLDELQVRYDKGVFDGHAGLLARYVEGTGDFEHQKDIVGRVLLTVSDQEEMLGALADVEGSRDEDGEPTRISRYVMDEIFIPMLLEENPGLLDHKRALKALARNTDPAVRDAAQQRLDDMRSARYLLIGTLVGVPIMVGLLAYWYRKSKREEDRLMGRLGRGGLVILLGLTAFQAMQGHTDASVREAHAGVLNYAVSQGIDPGGVARSQLSLSEQFAQLQGLLRATEGIPEPSVGLPEDLSKPVASSPVSDPLKPKNPGGIDLNPRTLNMNLQRDGRGVELPAFEQPFQDLRIEGIAPTIINVIPITNLPLMLGFKEEEAPQYSSIR